MATPKPNVMPQEIKLERRPVLTQTLESAWGAHLDDQDYDPWCDDDHAW